MTLQYSLVANYFAKGIETGLIDWQEANVDDVEYLASGIQKAMQVARHCGLSEAIYYEFDALDDHLFLARDGAYGSIQECRSDYTNLLAKFVQSLKIT